MAAAADPVLMQILINHINSEFSIEDLGNALWIQAKPIFIDKYWSGQPAPAGRCCSVRLLWSEQSLYALFEANQAEPLIVSDKPDIGSKTLGLWDRDVCEIFIAPDRGEPARYFEFEAAPTGEWVDLAIDLTTGQRVTNTEYISGMKCAAQIGETAVATAIRIDWDALGGRPHPGDIWAGNLFRCVGSGPDRGYLAWSPTMTERPDFHVPERFGEFRFVR